MHTKKISRMNYVSLRWAFVAERGLSLLVAGGGPLSSCAVRAARCAGSSCCRAQAPGGQASAQTQQLQLLSGSERGLSICEERSM